MLFIYQNLGEASRLKHQFDKAENLQKEAINLRKELNDEIGLADALSSLGLVYAQQCRHEEAEEAFLESISLYQKHGADSQIKRVNSYIDTMKTCPNY
jgi:tetratricopeptide (TPR) repeat protein